MRKRQEPEFLTVKEFAFKFRVSYKTVMRMLRADKIKGARKVGGQWRIPSTTCA